MNTKHKEYIEGKPHLGDRSRDHPGCNAYMDLAYFNPKSSQGKPRAQARPRFLENHDDVWNNWVVQMRQRGLTEQDVMSAISKYRHILSELITKKFKETCPSVKRKTDEPNCLLHYEYCSETEKIMSAFYLSELKRLSVPQSEDMFANQINNLGRI